MASCPQVLIAWLIARARPAVARANALPAKEVGESTTEQISAKWDAGQREFTTKPALLFPPLNPCGNRNTH
jgi:hypothetical protein